MSSSNNENKSPIPGSGKRKTVSTILKIALVAIGVALVAFHLFPRDKEEGSPQMLYPPVSPSPSENAEESEPSDVPVQHYYRTDVLFITSDREAYAGDMTLEIPRLEFMGPVLENVQQATLSKGVGLYDYSPLPGPITQNANVSIAGHRDMHGYEFYYMDTMTDGDLLYLNYQGQRYTYEYESTTIIEPDDWSVIYCTDYACLTLTTCDPIGVANKRMIVRAKLISVEDV